MESRPRPRPRLRPRPSSTSPCRKFDARAGEQAKVVAGSIHPASRLFRTPGKRADSRHRLNRRARDFATVRAVRAAPWMTRNAGREEMTPIFFGAFGGDPTNVDGLLAAVRPGVVISAIIVRDFRHQGGTLQQHGTMASTSSLAMSAFMDSPTSARNAASRLSCRRGYWRCRTLEAKAVSSSAIPLRAAGRRALRPQTDRLVPPRCPRNW